MLGCGQRYHCHSFTPLYQAVVRDTITIQLHHSSTYWSACPVIPIILFRLLLLVVVVWHKVCVCVCVCVCVSASLQYGFARHGPKHYIPKTAFTAHGVLAGKCFPVPMPCGDEAMGLRPFFRICCVARAVLTHRNYSIPWGKGFCE